MKSNALAKLHPLSLLLLCALLGASLLSNLPPADISQCTTLSTWGPVVHLSHNSFFNWRLNPSLMAFLEVLPRDKQWKFNASILVNTAVFLSGFLFLSRRFSRNTGAQDILLGSVAAVLLIPYLFGIDRVILTVFAWLPWTMLLTTQALEEKKANFWTYALLLFASVELALTANYLSLLLSPFALAFCCIHYWQESALRNRFEEKTFWLILVFTLAPAILFSVLTPSTAVPFYPILSEVITDDGVPGFLFPSLGPTSTVMLIDRADLRSSFCLFSILLFALSLASLLTLRKNSNVFSRACLSVAAGGALVTMWDVLPAESFTHIGPIATLSRVIPHLFFVALAPIVACLAMVFLVLGLLSTDLLNAGFASTTEDSSPLTSSSLMLPLTLFLIAFVPAKGIQTGALLSPSSQNAITEFRALDRANKMTGTTRQYVKGAIHSPSLNLLNKRGLHVLLNKDLIQAVPSNTLSFKNIAEYQPSFAASHNNGDNILSLVADNRPQTRWTTGVAQQSGKEWFHVHLNQEIKIKGVDFSPGSTYADFPRGIRIRTSSECEAKPTSSNTFASYSTVYDDPHWQGEIKFSKLGLPYYGGQDIVRIFLPHAVSAQCLLFEQTYAGLPFEWSIAEIKVLLDKEGY